MKINHNWQQLAKKHHIDVGLITDPYDIVHYFKFHNIKKYLYRINWTHSVLKFGMSCPSARTALPGERLYRQIGHATSWGERCLTGSSGADWLIIEKDFEKAYGIIPCHNKMTATIWDVSNYPFETINPFYEVNAMENILIEEYVKIVGQKPIGNINDEANARRRSGISKKLIEDLFFTF